MSDDAFLTYVYALVRAWRRPSLLGAPEGPPASAPLRLLPAGEHLWLAVSSVPARDYDADAVRRGLQDIDWLAPRALAHEAVVEHFLRAPALLPMPVLTLFTCDRRAVKYVSDSRERIEGLLDGVERRVEWVVRLTWNAQATVLPSARAATGAAYLAGKRDVRDTGSIRLATARAKAGRVFDALTSVAAKACRRGPSEAEAAASSRLLLDATFLVPSRGASAFRAALRRRTQELGEAGIAVSLTGPWPPYDFVR
ncbi:GvpL/GvpF family gas vesicle protein [Usitatibacter palustris]|uniref:Gas vesicle synthesis protein GvpL/GvpF n=1 Tax=Usitatibacter palustris TaxID=2732487 RepID=A0A6M4H9L4_9PROT|nr:GvpL/GvpF family gas vesicle protein [Usitatibacter palustris]QJR16280.1 hypothetical protein DSM104440_03109 [Usitatibacter palustris]